MKMDRQDRPVLALIVYAKRNIRDMAERAFRSIANQQRKPDKLLVVDDASEAGFDDVKERVLDLRLDNCHVQVLRNERTPGLCGAMNTALLKLMEYADERSTYVTFVREEDWLRHDHCASVEAAIGKGDCDLVLSDVKVEGLKNKLKMVRSSSPVEHLERLYGLNLDNASCLMAASSIRLGSLLEAGLYNEALQGMQTHELLLRLSELPDARWSVTGKATLGSPPSGYRKEELTDAVILAMRRGSRTFCLLARNRLNLKTEVALQKAIRRRRDQRDANTSLLRWGLRYDLKPTKARKIGVATLDSSRRHLLRSCQIVVGVLSRGNVDERDSGLPDLLRDLKWLSRHVKSIHVEVLDNAKRGDRRKPWFRRLPVSSRGFSVGIYEPRFDDDDASATGFQASIAAARSAIQRRVAKVIRGKGDTKTMAWFIDEDLSLVNRAMCWDDDECRRWFLWQLAALLQDARDKAGSDTAMHLGQVTEAPPVPATMTYRLQLLDAVNAVRRLRHSPLGGRYRYRDFQRILEKWVSPGREIRDFYYDVSSRDVMHLEIPFDYFPWENGEFRGSRATNGEVLRKVVDELPKLVKGKQIFRPIFADRHFAVDPGEMLVDGFPGHSRRPLLSHVPSVLRGGNTIVSNGSESDLYPTVTLKGLRYRRKPLTPRRADMVSALICRYLRGQKVVACSLPVRQRREDEGNKEPKALLNPTKYVADTEGFAIYSALKLVLDHRQLQRLDTKLGKNAKERCDFSKADFELFMRSIHEFRKMRLRAIIASFYRIRGLAKMLRQELASLSHLPGLPGLSGALAEADRFALAVIDALPTGFDRSPDGGLKLLSSPAHTVRYRRRQLAAFVKGLKASAH
jgi:hypothetical protein